MKTKCARNFKSGPTWKVKTHKCTGGPCCKGNCKPKKEGENKYRVYCMTEMIDGDQFSDHFDFDSKSDFMEIFNIERAGNAGMDYDIIRYLGYYDDEGNSFTVKDERL